MNSGTICQVLVRMAIFASVVTISQYGFGQKRHTPMRSEPFIYGSGLKLAPGLAIYDSKTSKYISNPGVVSLDIFVFYRNFHFGLGLTESYTYDYFLKKDITSPDVILTKLQEVRIGMASLKLGYAIGLGNGMSLQPTIGKIRFLIRAKDEREGGIVVNGYVFGVELTKYFLREHTSFIFVRNQLYKSNLSTVNPGLGNFVNVFSVGFGSRFGKLQ
jgi:hypothetical protein